MVACLRTNAFPIRERAARVATPKRQEILSAFYGLLVQAANEDAQCPTNKSLLDRWPSLTEHQVNKMFDQLEGEGKIRVLKTRNRRIVLIAETGKHTRLTKEGPFAQISQEFVGE